MLVERLRSSAAGPGHDLALDQLFSGSRAVDFARDADTADRVSMSACAPKRLSRCAACRPDQPSAASVAERFRMLERDRTLQREYLLAADAGHHSLPSRASAAIEKLHVVALKLRPRAREQAGAVGVMRTGRCP